MLASANNPLHGELAGAHLLDIAPTLLELGGYDVPTSMQGRSLVAGHAVGSLSPHSFGDEELVRSGWAASDISAERGNPQKHFPLSR